MISQSNIAKSLKQWSSVIAPIAKRWFPMLLLALCIFNLVFYMHREVSDYESVSWHIVWLNYVMMIFDTFCFTFLFSLLPIRRPRWIALPMLMATFFTVGNALYARNIEGYMPINAWFEFQNLEGLGSSIFGTMQWQDYLMQGITLVLVISVFFLRGSLPRMRERLSVLGVLIAFWGGMHLVLTRIDADSCDEWRESEFSTEHYIASRPSYIFTHGFFWSFYHEVASIGYSVELTGEQRNEITEFLNRPAFLHTLHRPRNLIFVMVESLITDPINQIVDSVEVTPTLNRLAREGFYCADVHSQVRYGESSDGQFIYFTGLLPKNSGITIFDNMKNDYLGLGTRAGDVGYTTALLNPAGRNFWRQDEVCAKYGIRNHYSVENYRDTYPDDPRNSEAWLCDEQVFRYAHHLMREHREDSTFLTILTISTHTPYNTPFEDAMVEFPSVKDSHYACYLQKAHYMDYHLGCFLDSLQTDSIMDDAVLVIAADHAAPDLFGKESISTTPVIICGPGIHKHALPVAARQTDIYPTLLNIFGYSHLPYMGLGHSLFDMDSTYVRPPDETPQHISNQIIYGNYFNQTTDSLGKSLPNE